MSELVTIEYNTEGIQNLLQSLLNRGSNLAPVMREISMNILDAVEENFEKEGNASEQWAPWSDGWRQRRQKLGFTGDGNKVLTLRGELAASITAQSDNDTAEVGTNKKYAAIHQFGGEAGRNKSAKIPARPFLVIRDEDREDIKNSIMKHLKGTYNA